MNLEKIFRFSRNEINVIFNNYELPISEKYTHLISTLVNFFSMSYQKMKKK